MLDNLFKKQPKPNDLVIGEPFDVKHVYHVGIDSASDNLEFWNANHQNTSKYVAELILVLLISRLNLNKFFAVKLE